MKRILTTLSLAITIITVRPAFSAEPAKEPTKVPVATCNDGKTAYKVPGPNGKPNHGGTCANHGGVAKWADGSPVKSHERKTEYK